MLIKKAKRRGREKKDLKVFSMTYSSYNDPIKFSSNKNVSTKTDEELVINLNVEFSAQYRHCDGSLFKDWEG